MFRDPSIDHAEIELFLTQRVIPVMETFVKEEARPIKIKTRIEGTAKGIKTRADFQMGLDAFKGD